MAVKDIDLGVGDRAADMADKACRPVHACPGRISRRLGGAIQVTYVLYG
ncbi:hypothetical protein Xcab_02749 [Xenorhabdus cabanillasii JM26]|nr:hypothetical protein Xcab_02749 [Xenorhabdus cabanillasii JM26]